jgi:AcrR family transcriptional regulator
VYNHIASKEDLLFSIMSGIMQELLEGTERTLATRKDPVERLRAAVEYHVSFHAERAQEVFVGNAELRSLPPARRALVIESRDRYEDIFRKIIADGARRKVFFVTDVRLVTYGILAICTHVADWYKPDGRLRINQVASIYSDFILRALTNSTAQVALGDVLHSVA